GQGSEVNDGVNGVLDFSTIISQQLQNLLPIIIAQGDVSRGGTYKEFLACNPKEYDGKGGAIVYTCWIEKMESVQDMSRCRDSQKVKYTAGSFVGKAVRWWNSQIHTRGREATIDAIEPKTIQKVMQIASTLTDKACRNGSIKNDPAKRGNEANIARIGIVAPMNVNPINARNPIARTCYECGSTDHIKNQGNQARGRAFMLGAEEAHHDPNIMTEKVRQLMSARTKEQKQEDIVLVRDFLE
nr:reverse transcriptase domain-containing protein [Tanacetum cinerariifolium]